MTDNRVSLAEQEIALLRALVKAGPLEPAKIAVGVREALIAAGYAHIVGGVLIVTSAGIVALSHHHRTDDTPVPR